MEIINATFYIKERKRADFSRCYPIISIGESCKAAMAIISMNHWKRTIGLSWSKNGRIRSDHRPQSKPAAATIVPANA